MKSLPLEVLKTQCDTALSTGAGQDMQRSHLSDPVSLSGHWEKLQTVRNNCIPNFHILSM